MKKIIDKKEYIIIAIIIIMFLCVSYLSFTSIKQLSGNARVVNYAGIVRGATQRLIKKELQAYPDDALINRLNSIVNELITGEGPNDLVVLHDTIFLDNMKQVQQSWSELKSEIILVRAGNDKTKLFELSEDYFILVDRTVSSAENFSERQVNKSLKILVGINIVLIGMILGGVLVFIRSSAIKRKADALGKIAYIDQLTQMPNRASCEREIDTLEKTPPEGTLAVFMFDMNNLKRVNDQLGHIGGDRIIADFARIIKTEGADYGFVGRYGGDEFIAIFANADNSVAETYLSRINEKIVSFNLLHVNELEKISFAAGFIVESMSNMKLLDMINEADGRMYARKRQMKENKEA